MKNKNHEIRVGDMAKISLEPEYLKWVRFFNMINIRKTIRGEIAEISKDKIVTITKDEVEPYLTRSIEIESQYITKIKKIRERDNGRNKKSDTNRI